MTSNNIYFPLSLWLLGMFSQWFYFLESLRVRVGQNIYIFIWKPDGSKHEWNVSVQNSIEDEKEKYVRANLRDITAIFRWWRVYKQMPIGDSSAQQQTALCGCALSLMHSLPFFVMSTGLQKSVSVVLGVTCPANYFACHSSVRKKANWKWMQCVHSVSEWKYNSCYCLVVECASKLWCGDLTDFGTFYLSTQQQYE